MCGRFTQTSSAESIAESFNVANVPTQQPRYNIAPTQPVATILRPSQERARAFEMLRWGLIPSWAKDRKIGARLINARAETAAEKPAFRSAFRHRRCLVLADGFYEWQQKDGKKQPFYVQMQNEHPFAFAGLWERWQDPDGETIETCTLLTTEANKMMSPVHNRMPVILEPKNYDLWLDPQVTQKELLQPLLTPYDSEAMITYPVSTKVNNPRNDSSECVERI